MADLSPTRYQVIPPVTEPEGFPYWLVVAPGSEVMPNFAVVSIWKKLPKAEAIARELCRRLNGEAST